MKTRRGLAYSAMAALLALSMAGCAPQLPENAWRVSPVTVNEEPRGENDVTFLLSNVSDDTAGGFWAESAGSWLRVAADETITRFNYFPEGLRHASDIAAANETTLYVLRPLGSGSLNTTVELFDTAQRSTRVVLGGQRVQTSPDPVLPFTPDGPVTADSPFGAITSIDVDAAGNLVFVERVDEPPHFNGFYVVRRLHTDNTVETLAGLPNSPENGFAELSPAEGQKARDVALAAITVDVSAGDPRGVIVATEHSVFQITDAGTARIIAGSLATEDNPFDAVSGGVRMPVRPVDSNAAGAVLLPMPLPYRPATHYAIDITGGSKLFRQILAEPPERSGDHGLGIIDENVSTSDALRHAEQAAWVDDDTIIAIMNSGGTSIAVRIETQAARP